MTAAASPPKQLPAWPLFLLFAAFPLWWATGFAAFAVILVAVPMLVLLGQRRQLEIPPAFWLWIGFLIWATAAALELSSSTRLIGFGVRMCNYLGSTIVFVYVYNARERLTDRMVLRALALFFAFVVVGGYLGMLIPHGSLHTPAESLLPVNIAQNEYVHSLVHPSFAEVQQPYGSPRPFYRPSAPFPYTNSWGCNVALLVPLVIAAVTLARRRSSRLVLLALLAAACLPAFATLNRGMFLAIGILLGYAAMRLAFRGQLIPLVAIVAGGALGAVIALSTGVLATLQTRLHYSRTNLGRQTIYREAFDGALQSPIFGHGAPQPSQTLTVSVGTQGQVWNVMFSYGFVALALFLGWFLCATLLSWRAGNQARLWMHATVFICLLTFFYYGYDGIQLTVAMVAAALALRPATRPRRAEPARAYGRALARA